jgi:hypothetical protein
LTVKVIGLQAQVGEKLSEEDFGPSVIALNEQLAAARGEIDKVSSRPPKADPCSTRAPAMR